MAEHPLVERVAQIIVGGDLGKRCPPCGILGRGPRSFRGIAVKVRPFSPSIARRW